MSDEALAAIVDDIAPDTIDEVIVVMERIDAALPDSDGLKWFNLLYLMVTRAVRDNPPAAGWADERWLHRLDVIFANLYFSAVRNWLHAPASVPRSWRALFEARGRARVARVQFALAGMNAHINHDLPLALVETGDELNVMPDEGTPQHADFRFVNGILERVESEIKPILSVGPLGEIIQNSGRLGSVIAIWNVRQARETAWNESEVLWHFRHIPLLRRKFMHVLDKVTGVIGRGLLVPVE